MMSVFDKMFRIVNFSALQYINVVRMKGELNVTSE